MNKLKEAAFIFSGIVIVLALIYGIVIVKNPTGHAVLNLEPNYQKGEILNGNLKISLSQGELIPADSKIILESENETREYSLNELISDSSLHGNLYIQGSSLSGSGEGYGLIGEKITYPEISFILQLIPNTQTGTAGSPDRNTNVQTNTNPETPQTETPTPDANNSEANEKTEIVNETPETQVIATDTETTANENTETTAQSDVSAEAAVESEPEIAPENSEPVEETTTDTPTETSEVPTESAAESPSNEAPEESQPAPITGGIISNLLGLTSNLYLRITGYASLNSNSQIEGKVSAENPFVYTLQDNEVSVKIIEGSVKTLSETLPENAINAKVEGNQLVVATDYFQSEEGFGQDFIGNEEKSILINLESLNFVPSGENIRINLVHNGISIISLDANLNQAETSNGTEVVENLTEIPEEIIEEIPSVLTESERKILEENFGNLSVEITKAEKVEGGFVVRQEIGDYWIENFYDSNFESRLESKVADDRNLWLRDLSKELSKEKTNSEVLENLIGEHEI